ncbi:methyltransferase [Rhodococcus sp. 14-1411-2a]|uniref:methyltransferase n=1 Tax=Rhodococcus sp. 14-1411-2a TaxID=2023151 RepID=UPI000B9ADD08|nr:hypothetical protein CH291_17885 [Rhodococcus sp. 14-1411-2a]
MSIVIDFTPTALTPLPEPGGIYQVASEHVKFRLSTSLEVQLELVPDVSRPNLYSWELADWIATSGSLSRTSIVDLGCGSGAIGVTAALAGAHHVTCVDNFDVAIDVTRRNCQANGAASVKVIRSDWLSSVDSNSNSRLVVVSSPPHTPINTAMLEGLPVQTPSFLGASFGGRDGLDAIRLILDQLRGWDNWELILSVAGYQYVPILKLAGALGLETEVLRRRPTRLSALGLYLRTYIESVSGYKFESQNGTSVGYCCLVRIVKRVD